MSASSGRAVPDLRYACSEGLGWVGGSQVGLQLTRAVTAIAVARLLTPDEYGLAMLALVFASLVLVFSDLALGAALIQRPTLSEVDRDTAFWVTVGAAASCSRCSAWRSPARSPRSTVTRTPSRCSPCSRSASWSARSAPPAQSLMLREMDFRRVEILPMLGALGGGVAGVALAARGAGAWAIILQYIVAIGPDDRAGLAAFALEAALRVLGGEPPRSRRFQPLHAGHRLLYYLQTTATAFSSAAS